MAARRGSPAVRRRLEDLPSQIMTRVLPGAARAGARVIAQGAKDLLGGKRATAGAGKKVLIADSVKVRAKKRPGLIVARVLLAGPGAYVGRWLEFGTDPHFISVDPSYREGMTTRRINKRVRDGDSGLRATLMINGKPVGATVFHPGAAAHPFLRPALDTKRSEATAKAQAYINSHVTRRGIVDDGERNSP